MSFEFPCKHFGKFEIRSLDYFPEVYKIICEKCKEFNFCSKEYINNRKDPQDFYNEHKKNE